MSTDVDLQRYLHEAISWDEDRRKQSARLMRTGWSVAAGGWLTTVALAATLMLMMPLKRVEPFVVRVDNSTGIVDVVPGYIGQHRLAEPVTRYFITHYVTVCERFNFATAESDYRECGAFHGALRNQEWFAQWTRSNPASPLNRYKDGTTVRIQVRSVSFFEKANGMSDLAQVRYLRAERQGSSQEQVSYWIANIQYGYASPSSEAGLRSLNPLGFKVISFRREPEVVQSSEGLAGDRSGGGAAS